jgi:hypothetical protein
VMFDLCWVSFNSSSCFTNSSAKAGFATERDIVRNRLSLKK